MENSKIFRMYLRRKNPKLQSVILWNMEVWNLEASYIPEISSFIINLN